LNNFILKSFMDLLVTLPREKINMAFLGSHSPLESFEVISKYFEMLGIKSPPLSSEHLFNLLNLKYDDYYNLQEFMECDKEYDLVFNCDFSHKSIDQLGIFNKIHEVTKDNGLILNCVPWCTMIETGFYSYNPEFFNYIARTYNYAPHVKAFGTKSAKFYYDFDESEDGFANENYKVTTGNVFYRQFPSKAWLEECFIATVFQKPSKEVKEEENDTNSDTTDEVEIQS